MKIEDWDMKVAKRGECSASLFLHEIGIAAVTCHISINQAKFPLNFLSVRTSLV